MRAFYNADGEVMGYVESEHESGFSIEGMSARSVEGLEIEEVKNAMKAKKNLRGPKDIKPPKEIKPDVTVNPKV